MVRVRLDTAIQFIWDLLQKEQNTSEEECQRAAQMREKQDLDCQAWVSNVITRYQQVGLEGQGDSWLAFRRALARTEKEAFNIDKLSLYTESLDKW